MKERARELKASARRGGSKTAKADEEADVLAKIAEMTGLGPGDSRAAARDRQGHRARGCAPRTWYGMPARTPGTARSSASSSPRRSSR